MAVEYQTGLKPVEIAIESLSGDSISLTGSTFSIDYFEDILEPAVTMQITLNGSYNLVSELPIRGGEKVNVELELASGTFKKEMFVYKASSGDFQRQTGAFILNLTTKDSLSNETNRCKKRYSDQVTIDKHVTDILKNTLKVSEDRIKKIEQTSNTYGFFGNIRKPFQVCQWLCPKGISNFGVSGTTGKRDTKVGKGKGTAGFFFYENADGYHFRSIDSLVSDTRIQDDSADAEKTFTYTSKGFGGIDSNLLENNFQIINHFMDRNIDMKKAFGIGLYKNSTYFYNTLEHEVSYYHYDLKDEIKDSHLGQNNIEGAPTLFGQGTSRIIVRTSDHGVLGRTGELNDSGRDNADMAKSFSRYNLLFTQALNILVPCNLDLKAGNVIKCELPRIQEGQSREIDLELSGYYLIKEVRHHIEVGEVTTSLKLIRDSYGFKVPTST